MGKFKDLAIEEKNSILEGNKLIAEFMGYKLAKCNNGLAWESPYKKSVEDTFELHGRLWRENDSYYKFHTSWDWLMPVANEIIKSRDEQNADWDLTDLKYALCTTNIELVYKAVVKFINEYNQNT